MSRPKMDFCVREFYRALLPLCWTLFSSSLTLYNKYLFSTININIPFSLSCLHLLCIALVTLVINQGSIRIPRYASLLHLSTIALYQAFSIVTRNKAYAYMSVPAMQVFSAFSPAWVYWLSIFMMFETFRMESFLYISGITAGAILASIRDFRANLTGICLQGSGILLEGFKTLLLKRFLQRNSGLGITEILFLSSCFSTIFMLVPAVIFEGQRISQILSFTSLGLESLILGNAVVAVLLNIVSMEFVRFYPATILSLSAVSKDIILVFLSPFIFQTKVESSHYWYILSALSTILYVLRRER